MRVKFSFRSFVGQYVLLAHIVLFCSLSHASVPFECEAALSGPAQTFIRLLDEGLKPSKGQPALISKANLQAMSAENLNPLVNEVRTSANASLKAAFSKLSTQIQADEAKAILSHVNKILGIRQTDEALKQESQVRTAPIFAPAKVTDLNMTRIIGPGTVGSPHMHLDRNGRPIVAIAVNNPSRRIELLTFDSLDRSDFVRQSVELGFTQEVRFFSDSKRDLWAAFVGPSRTAGNQIEVRNLTNQESFTATSPGSINESLHWFEDGAGRIFLAALQSDRVADGQYKLEIFELTHGGLKSIFNVGLRNKMSWELHSSKRKELFVTAVDQDHVLQTWSLSSSEKISQWKISPDSLFQPFVTSTGEVVVAVTTSSTSLEPNKFYRSGHPEPISSHDLFDNYASRVWHETDDGRLLFVTQIRLDGLPKLALYEPFNVQTQDKWQPKFPRVRKFLRQSVPSAYSFTKPVSTHATENLAHQPSRWIQKPDGS